MNYIEELWWEGWHLVLNQTTFLHGANGCGKSRLLLALRKGEADVRMHGKADKGMDFYNRLYIGENDGYEFPVSDKLPNRGERNKKCFMDIMNECFIGFTCHETEGGTLVYSHPPTPAQRRFIAIIHTLLFETYPRSLVLIDEPERGLHIATQRMMYEYIQRAQIINGDFQVIMATHSPDIVQGYGDFAVAMRKE